MERRREREEGGRVRERERGKVGVYTREEERRVGGREGKRFGRHFTRNCLFMMRPDYPKIE